MDAMKKMRENVKIYIETADEKVVKMVHAMLEVDAKGAQEAGWYKNMPDDVKARLESSFEQGERGEVIPHDEVKKKYPKWFSK